MSQITHFPFCTALGGTVDFIVQTSYTEC